MRATASALKVQDLSGPIPDQKCLHYAEKRFAHGGDNREELA